MVRRSDWDRRLVEFIEERMHTPFRWGHTDCAVFACDALHAMTGIDYGKEFRGTYSTQIGAARAIKKLGSDLMSATEKILNADSIQPRLAQRGDIGIVLVGEERLQALAVSVGNAWVVPAEDPPGLLRFPVDEAVKAWRIS